MQPMNMAFCWGHLYVPSIPIIMQFIHSIEFTRDVSKEFLSNRSSMRGAHVKLISITVAIQCQLLYSTLLITMF